MTASSWAQSAEYPDGIVTAESLFGNGRISGPVRQTNLGYDVQLPSGSWVPCIRSCGDTLRVETIDYWDARKNIVKECGVFGCLKLEYPR